MEKEIEQIITYLFDIRDKAKESDDFKKYMIVDHIIDYINNIILKGKDI